MDFYVSKLRALDEQLQLINDLHPDILQRSQASIKTCMNTLHGFKQQILQHNFKDQAQEIDFFRNIKPQFLSRLIYHVSVFKIENKRPLAQTKIIKQYLAAEQNRLRHIFDSNHDFYQYYRIGHTHFDHIYFIRGGSNLELPLGYYFLYESDDRFTTGYDFIVASFLAAHMLREYLLIEIKNLKKQQTQNTPDAPHTKLNWTANKVSLIELIYGLHTQGVFDNGRADLKTIATHFEKVFNINLGDYYSAYREICLRKTGNTKFIDQLKQGLTKRLSDQDELRLP